MNNRMPPSRAPRPAPTPPDKPSKHFWHHRYHWPHWNDYDWYDHDYDWYDNDYEYDYDNYLYAPPKKVKAPAPGKNWDMNYDPMQEAYRQGFKDGWQAAVAAMGKANEVVTEPPVAEPSAAEAPTK